MVAKSPSWVQENFRFRLDDGSQASATYYAAENITASITINTVFRLRLNVGDIGAANQSNNVSWKIQYNVNAAGWNTVGATGPVVYSTSGFVTDGNNDANERLTGIGGSTFNSAWQEFDDNNALTAQTWNDDYTEYEFALDTSVTAGASVQYRVIASDGNVPTITNTPTSIAVGAAAGQTVTPDAIASAESVPNPTLTAGAVSVVPDAIASAETVPDPTLSPQAVTVVPDAIASAESVPDPTVTQSGGQQTVSPDAIASAESVPDPVLNIGSVTVTPDAIASAETVPDPTLSVGSVTVTPDAIASAEAVPNPTITQAGGLQTVSPDAIASAESVPNPVIVPGSVTATPDAIASSESVPDPTLTPLAVTIVTDAIASSEIVYDPTVSLASGPQTVEPDAIASGETVYDVTLIDVSESLDEFAGAILSGGKRRAKRRREERERRLAARKAEIAEVAKIAPKLPAKPAIADVIEKAAKQIVVGPIGQPVSIPQAKYDISRQAIELIEARNIEIKASQLEQKLIEMDDEEVILLMMA